MGLDGLFLKAVEAEIALFKGARVEKIFQISSYEIVFVLKKFKQTKNLIVSAGSSVAKMHFTKNVLKNFSKSYFFETLLKSKLKRSWLLDVKQKGLDRVFSLKFKAKDEIGEEKNFVVCAEFLPRYSNIIFYEEKTLKILDAIKKISLDSYEKRPVLPKLKFVPLKCSKRLNLLEKDPLELLKAILNQKSLTLKDAILKTLEGFGTFTANVLSFKFKNKLVSCFSEKEKELLFEIFVFLQNIFKEKNFEFVAVFKEGVLKEFSFFNVTGFCENYSVKKFKSSQELLDFFYKEKDFLQRQLKTKNSVFKILKNEILKTKNTIKKREQELKKANEKKNYKEYADLLSANIFKIKKGQKEIEVEDFYNSNKKICLSLNPKYSAAKNVQNYYKTYKKAKTAKAKLKDLLKEAKSNLEFLKQEFSFLKGCTTTQEMQLILEEIKQEIKNFNFIKQKPVKKQLEKELPFLKFKSSDGFLIFCGRNSKQNELLTVKKATKDDVWFHIKDLSGAHVVVFSNNKKISQTAILQAATIAAYFSDAKDEKKADVWYTLIRNVKKEKGLKLGMVNFKNVKTINVLVNFELVENLKLK